MSEEWRDIDGYIGLYQVSNLGRVRSLDRIVKGKNGANRLLNGRTLNTFKDTAGYCFLYLSKSNIRKRYSVHRLVAEMFIPNPDKKPQVNHKNGIKNDNSADNLEWVTISENQRHAFATGLHTIAKKNARAKLSYEQVSAIRNEYVYKDPKHNTVTLAEKYGVSKVTILKILKKEIYKKI